MQLRGFLSLGLSSGLLGHVGFSQLSRADAFHVTRPVSSAGARRLGPLWGIAEWRAKFASDAIESAPLLLLPFTPSDIILPGQSTTLKFKHGKFMDMIDEALTSYDSVVGLSVLDEDGMLPYVVLCEVVEEEMEVNMGYRGFSSMEVGVRAVGRAKRIPDSGQKAGEPVPSNNDTIYRGRKALDDIHVGQFSEWRDDPLDTEAFYRASGYLSNIEELLGISSDDESSLIDDSSTDSNDGMQLQQQLYLDACRAALKHPAADNRTYQQGNEDDSKGRLKSHAHLAAASWATLAVSEGNARTPSIIMQALETKDTAERLRLGLASILEGSRLQTRNAVEGKNGGDDAFQ